MSYFPLAANWRTGLRRIAGDNLWDAAGFIEICLERKI
jgi:hypothetical protein